MIRMARHSYNITADIKCYDGVILDIGDYCSIASGLEILSGTHPCIKYPQVVSTYPFHEKWGADYPESKMGGQVTIGNDVWIAKDVKILEGVTIGNGVIIGSNSVVTKDVPDYCFVAGNPAVIKRQRFSDEQIKSLLDIKWWKWSDYEVAESLKYMKDINEFIKQYENSSTDNNI